MSTGKAKYAAATDQARLQRIEALLIRYPDTSSDEEEEIVHFLSKGPLLDRGLLTGMESVRSKLKQFQMDHRRKLSLNIRDYAAVLVLIIAVITACAFLWNAGAGH